MQQGLCKARQAALPSGMCCNEDGELVLCAGGPRLTPNPDDYPPAPLPTPPGGGSTGSCAFGTGYCDPEYLKSYFNNDQLATQRASRVCRWESNSNPAAANTTCQKAGGTMDYSIGLFQFNLLAHCSSDLLKNFSDEGYSGPAFNARQVFQYTSGKPQMPCIILRQDLVDKCKAAMLNPVNNIKKAAAMSGNGQNWKAWSTWPKVSACENTGSETIPPPPPGQSANCPDSSQRIMVPGTTYQHLNQYHYCITPKMVVIHWSAAWTTAQATFDVLNKRDRSCQFATDANTSLQMLDFYPNKVRQGWCVGGSWNDVSISIEISGAYFDNVIKDVPGKPGEYDLNDLHARYATLKAETDRAMALTCWSLKQYNIPKTEIYGHYELNSGKIDAGKNYGTYFKQRVLKEC